MNLRKLILTKNRCYMAGKKITPSGIMVHSTGANNPNLKRYVGPDDGLLGVNQYGNHWNSTAVDVCVHAFIGKLKDGSIATYQTLPWDHRAWHAGASANNTHISFEICEDDLTDRNYFNKVYQEAVELCAYLCKLYNLNPLTQIVCHSEGYKLGIASAHADVMHWFPRHGKSMDTFRADVKTAMGKPSESATSTTKPNVETATEATGQLYRVRTAWSNAKSQIGAYSNLDNAKAACKAGYKVYNSTGKVVYDPNETAVSDGFTAYKVRVDSDVLRIRKGPGTNYDWNGKYTGSGCFTIVEEAAGEGATKWGLLKSYKKNRNGWISLDYAQKI